MEAKLRLEEIIDSKKTLHLRWIKAVLFDMDGTMVNNIPYHKKAWQEFGRRHGIYLESMTRKEFRQKISGKRNKEILPVIFSRDLRDEEIKHLADEKEGIYRDLYAPHVESVEGLHSIITQLKASGIKLAVATAAQERNRRFILHALGLADKFDTIIDEEQITYGKPDPEIFLRAAKELDVEPEQCLVFEDSIPGVKAARRAGMKVVAVLTSHKKSEFADADIDLAIDNFSQLSLKP